MKKFFEGVVNFIYGIVTGTKRVRLFLTPLFGFVFSCIVLLLLFLSLYLDYFWYAKDAQLLTSRAWKSKASEAVLISVDWFFAVRTG